jgi:transcriptional regulator with XRE-family HTH domain
MSFRKIIRAEVTRQGLSGYRVAKLSGIPMRTVQAYLAGSRDLTGERLARIVDALGLELRPRRRRKGR